MNVFVDAQERSAESRDALIALLAEGEPAPEGATVVHRECWECGTRGPCVFIGGWVASWRCPGCIANRWYIADREHVRELIEMTANLADIVATLCRKRWLPAEIAADDPEMLEGAFRAHAIKIRLEEMEQTP